MPSDRERIKEIRKGGLCLVIYDEHKPRQHMELLQRRLSDAAQEKIPKTKAAYIAIRHLNKYLEQFNDFDLPPEVADLMKGKS